MGSPKGALTSAGQLAKMLMASCAAPVMDMSMKTACTGQTADVSIVDKRRLSNAAAHHSSAS